MSTFNLRRFGNWGSTMNKFAPQAHLYKSVTDTIATILVAGYFNDRVNSLDIGDVMYVVATDKVALLKISALTPNVTTAVIDLEGHGLDQAQIYYWGDNGKASNNGLNDDSPFDDPNDAITAILAQVPGPNNRFEIQTIGSPVHVGDLVIPTYTSLIASTAHIKGAVTLLDQSKIDCKEVTAGNSAAAINMTTPGIAYVDVDLVNGGTSSIGINASQGNIKANIKHIDMSGASSKAHNLAVGGALFLNCQTLRENVASTNDGSGAYFENILDKGSNADTVLSNKTGDMIIQTNGHNIKLLNGASEIFTHVGDSPKWTNTPNVEANSNVVQTDVTGDASLYTLICDQEVKDTTGIYNPVTGIATLGVTGTYILYASVSFIDLAVGHTKLELHFNVGGVIYPIRQCDPWEVRDKVSNVSGFSGSAKVEGSATDTVFVELRISGGAKVIDIPTNAQFGLYLLTT